MASSYLFFHSSHIEWRDCSCFKQRNITLLAAPVASAQYLANLAAFFDVFRRIRSSCDRRSVRHKCYQYRVYEDIDIDNKFREYRAGEIDGATFDKSISMTLLNNLKENEERTQAKATGYAKTLTWFLYGLILLIAHFIVLILSTSFF